jgi:hypothetical protein
MGGQSTGGQSTGGQSTGGQGTGGANCPLPPYSNNPVSIRIENNTASNIYIGKTAQSCKFETAYQVLDVTNTALKLVLDSCEFSCGDVQTGGCVCPPTACDQSVVTLVAPGGHYDAGWPGTYFADPEMAASCYADQANCAAKGCFSEIVAPFNATIQATAGTQAQGCAGSCNDCTPGPAGKTCTVSGADHIGGTLLKATFAYTGQSSAVLSFN